MTETLRENIRSHKTALLSALTTPLDGSVVANTGDLSQHSHQRAWSFADIYSTGDEQTRYLLDERAGILEFDAHLPRHTAEERAAREWSERHNNK